MARSTTNEETLDQFSACWRGGPHGFSTALSPERFNEVVRQNRGTENRLHLRLDAVINEDQDRISMGRGPHDLAALKHMALNAMQKEGEKDSTPDKFKPAG